MEKNLELKKLRYIGLALLFSAMPVKSEVVQQADSPVKSISAPKNNSVVQPVSEVDSLLEPS